VTGFAGNSLPARSLTALNGKVHMRSKLLRRTLLGTLCLVGFASTNPQAVSAAQDIAQTDAREDDDDGFDTGLLGLLGLAGLLGLRRRDNVNRVSATNRI
jgi:MYXO-CTERM domain-containing protein